MSQPENPQFTYVTYKTNYIQVGNGIDPCITNVRGTFEVPSQVNSKDVISIGDYAFLRCEITKIILPDTIQIIGYFAFQQCKISEFICPKNVNQVGTYAFFYCSCLLADFSQTTIKQFYGEYIFVRSSIVNIILPNSLETIPAGMFSYSDIKNITIPKSCKTIALSAFIGCISLEEFYSESPEFIVNNKVLYSKDYKILYGYPSNCFADLLPTITTISPARGFSGATFVNFTLKIPLKRFDKNVFRRCPNLEFLDLSCAEATSIDHGMFYESEKLRTVILPKLLQDIQTFSFSFTDIRELILPPYVHTLVPDAFNDSKITDIYYCGLNTFGSISLYNTNIKMHVSDTFPNTVTKLLGCTILTRTFVCPAYNFDNLIDQSFMDCPSIKVHFYDHFNMNMFLYAAIIVL